MLEGAIVGFPDGETETSGAIASIVPFFQIISPTFPNKSTIRQETLNHTSCPETPCKENVLLERAVQSLLALSLHSQCESPTPPGSSSTLVISSEAEASTNNLPSLITLSPETPIVGVVPTSESME